MQTNSIRSWLFLGFAIPIIAEILGAILIINIDSRAYGAGFSYIVVLVILIIAIPITLIGNAFLVPRHLAEKPSYLFRGMTLPLLFIGTMLIYQTGIWDQIIRPLLPRDRENIQTARGRRLDDNTLEDFFWIEEFTGSDNDMNEIENYATTYFEQRLRECTQCRKMNVYYYFVPRELYDPIDAEASKERAVAVFRYMGTEGNATFQRVPR